MKHTTNALFHGSFLKIPGEASIRNDLMEQEKQQNVSTALLYKMPVQLGHKIQHSLLYPILQARYPSCFAKKLSDC